MEHLVTSLDTSKKLSDLGLKKDSYFWHIRLSDSPNGMEDWILRNMKWGEGAVEQYHAYTSGELGEMLPCNDGEAFYLTQKGLIGNLWYVTRCRLTNMEDLHRVEAETEVEARAKMLIYLIENCYIKPEDL